MARRKGKRRSKARRKARKGGNAKFAHAIRRLRKLPKQQQVQAMGMANNKFIRQLCTHVKKLKHAKVSAKTAKSLRRHAKQIRKLVHRRTSITQKRKMLTQRGGGLITGLIIPAVASLVGAIFGRK